MDVFDVFKEIDFTFLEVKLGSVYGNEVLSEKSLKGVFKLRNSEKSSSDMYTNDSDATIHVHPEDFIEIDEIIGNGVRVYGIDYRIDAITEGKNFDSGEVEHLTLKLRRTSHA